LGIRQQALGSDPDARAQRGDRKAFAAQSADWLSRGGDPDRLSRRRSPRRDIDLLWEELGGRTPAIAVAVLDEDFESAGAHDRSRGTLDVELYFVSSHRRELTEGRTVMDAGAAASNARDPGFDAALELAWQFLFAADLGLGTQVQPLKLRREHLVIANNELSLWRQHWTTS
jgi:hypothetical protein